MSTKQTDRSSNGSNVDSALEIIIIGGSLAGLMAGITLKHAGHNVYIYERDSDLRESHMAGIGLGPDAKKFLEQHDRSKARISHLGTGLNIMRNSDMVGRVPANRHLTSWDTLYYLLRRNFDSYTSTYFPDAPAHVASNGSATYLSRHVVTDFNYNSESSKIEVRAQHRDTSESSIRSADFVIGADGGSSIVRAKYLPYTRRRYVGNITWRGVVPESDLTAETRQLLDSDGSILLLDRSHIVAYMVPGPAGSLEPGNRLLNFVWYDDVDTRALAEILVDGLDPSGQQRHHYTVPAGRVRKDIWHDQVRRAENLPFALPFLEMIRKARSPFVQVLTECCSPRHSFEHGRVLLVGDAASLNRPNNAFSCSQAAFHATLLGRYFRKEISLDTWDRTMHRFSLLHWSQAEWFGKHYQGNRLRSAVAYLVHRWYCLVDRVAAWWYGEEPLLREFAA